MRSVDSQVTNTRATGKTTMEGKVRGDPGDPGDHPMTGFDQHRS